MIDSDVSAQVAKLRKESQDYLARREESFQRCDTDGFLSQWADGLHSNLKSVQADILENGGKAQFVGLYTTDGRRVAARMFSKQFGYRTVHSWLLHQDEQKTFGRVFIPQSNNMVGEENSSKIQKKLGLVERYEMAPAAAKIDGQGRGLSGSAWVATYRTGDKWGLDSEPLPE